MTTGSVIDLLDSTKGQFIGKPLKELYKNHSFSKKSFVLFFENPDGSGRKRLGDDFNLSLLIARNASHEMDTVVDIYRYYDQIHVVVNPPEG